MKLFKRKLKRLLKEAEDHWVFKVELAMDDVVNLKKEVEKIKLNIDSNRGQINANLEGIEDSIRSYKHIRGRLVYMKNNYPNKKWCKKAEKKGIYIHKYDEPTRLGWFLMGIDNICYLFKKILRK